MCNSETAQDASKRAPLLYSQNMTLVLQIQAANRPFNFICG